MHVQVEDEHALRGALAQQRRGCDGEVVEDAEAGAGVGEGVVRAARRVHRQAALERQPRRQQRACRRPAMISHAQLWFLVSFCMATPVHA